ncbi:MAG: hypothetical protein H6553_05065 [Chitinophagales bacterium]|nr:hypothetical protein [Chitinophagales bacterium]
MDIFKSIRENKLVEGVAAMQNLVKTTGNLMSLISDNKVSNSVREMLKGLRTILTEKPNITSVNHFINHFLLQIDPENQPIVIKELLEVFHERWKNVDRKTAEIAQLNYDFNQKKIVLFAQDEAVIAMIEAMHIKQMNFNLTQILSKVDKLGKEQARKIANIGVKLTAIDDSNMAKYIKEADIIVIGCDIVMHDVFIAKIGTQSLCSIANFYQKPVFVLADTRKILNKKYFPQSVVDTFIGRNKTAQTTIWKDAPDNVMVIDSFLEEIPNNLITKFVFEKEAYTPNELTEQVDKVLVSKFF